MILTFIGFVDTKIAIWLSNTKTATVGVNDNSQFAWYKVQQPLGDVLLSSVDRAYFPELLRVAVSCHVIFFLV